MFNSVVPEFTFTFLTNIIISIIKSLYIDNEVILTHKYTAAEHIILLIIIY